MIVDDIEDHGDPEGMSVVYKAAKVLGPAVQAGRREEVDAVISPAEPTCELRHGHNFNAGDTEFCESRQLTRSRLPAPLRSEGADMHLVDHQLLTCDTAPSNVGPSEAFRIDDLRRPVWSFRLKSRRRVRKSRFILIEAEAIAHARPCQ